MDTTSLSPSLGQIWASSDFLNSSGSPATGRVAYMAHKPYITYVDIGIILLKNSSGNEFLL